jgi:hypothetical protein
MEWTRPQRVMKLNAVPQQTIMVFLGKRSVWEQSVPSMHNQMGQTPRPEPEDGQQDREAPVDAPLDQTMDAWGRTWAEEITAAPEVIYLDTRADDSIDQLQAWFTQETEKKMQKVTSDGNRDLRRLSLLWHLYQRKAAVARTVRPWKGRLSALGQPLEEPHTSDASSWTNGERTHHEQWIKQSNEVAQIRNQEKCVRWQHSINTNAAVEGRATGFAGMAMQQHQQNIVIPDSVHKDMGRW